MADTAPTRHTRAGELPSHIRWHQLAECESTQSYARSLIDSFDTATVVCADRQSAGSGRDGRTWTDTGHHAVFLSVAIPGPLPHDVLQDLPLRIATTVAHLTGTTAREPNDLYLDEDKCGGVLIDARSSKQHVDWLIIGIGLNVAASPGVRGELADSRRWRALALSQLPQAASMFQLRRQIAVAVLQVIAL